MAYQVAFTDPDGHEIVAQHEEFPLNGGEVVKVLTLQGGPGGTVRVAADSDQAKALADAHPELGKLDQDQQDSSEDQAQADQAPSDNAPAADSSAPAQDTSGDHISDDTAEQPSSDAVDAAPAAVARAEEHGVDLAEVEGSGVDGRVTAPDVVAHVQGQEGDGA